MPAETPILLLANTALWKQWLGQNCTTSGAILLTAINRGAPETTTSITYDDALDEALCHGWIDSGGRKIDASQRLIRFGPRKADSLWSARNVKYAERLEEQGRMQPHGRAAIELAKASGRWDAAYSAASDPPPEFFAALDEKPAARATWESLSKGNRWHIYIRLATLKTQAGREKRVNAFVEILSRGETPLPQKQIGKRKANGDESLAPRVSAEPSPAPPPSTRRTRSGRPVPSYAKQG